MGIKLKDLNIDRIFNNGIEISRGYFNGSLMFANYDYDTVVFIDAVGTLTETEEIAIDNLVTELKSNGTWDKYKAIYPFIGGTASSHKWNLKDPRDLDAAFRLTFTGGVTHSVSGITGNATDGYANTYLTPSDELLGTSASVGVYNRESSLNNGAIYGSQPNAIALSMYPDFNGSFYSYIWGFANSVVTTPPNSQSYFVSNQLGGTTHKAYANGIQIGTTNTGDNTENFVNANIPIYLLAKNLDGVGDEYSNANISFVVVGDGLTDAEVLTDYYSITKYQIALGRANIDVDAQSYITAHGNMTTQQQVVINNFFVNLKADGVYDNLQALWLPTYDNAADNKWNLINPLDTNAAHRLSYSGVGTLAHTLDGIKSDGVAYVDSNFNFSSASTLSDVSFGFYNSVTEILGSTQIWLGVEDASSKVFAGVVNGGSQNSAILAGTGTGDYVPGISDTPRTGMHIANIESGTRILSYYHEGVSLGGSEVQDGIAFPNANLGILANHYFGTYFPVTLTKLRMIHVGSSLTETQITDFTNAVNTLLTNINYDPDAQLFIDAVTTLTEPEAEAIDGLVRSLKTEGLWTKLDAIYPFIGGTAAEHKWNLKDPRDLDAAFRLTFTGGVTHSVSGITGDGTTGYAQTYITPNTTFAATSVNGAFYGKSVSTNAGAIYGAGVGDSVFHIYPNYLGETRSFIWNWSNSVAGPQSTTDRFFQQNQLGGTSHKVFINGAQYLTTNTVSNTSSFPDINVPMDILAGNNNGTHYDFSDATLSYVAFGAGFTDLEMGTYHDIVEAYQVDLGRQN